jgi:hypothetical protein
VFIKALYYWLPKLNLKFSLYTLRTKNKVGRIRDGVPSGELVHRSIAEPLRNTFHPSQPTNPGEQYDPSLQLR